MMKSRIAALPGTPMRIRQPVRWNTEDKLDLPPESAPDMRLLHVRIEVAGGRNSTRSTMRAARVQQALENVGATGRTVEVEEGRATLAAEASRKQVLYVARLPFVRRISVC
jgi:hypothetical protein